MQVQREENIKGKEEGREENIKGKEEGRKKKEKKEVFAKDKEPIII